MVCIGHPERKLITMASHRWWAHPLGRVVQLTGGQGDRDSTVEIMFDNALGIGHALSQPL